jgi:hypothetical protein
LVSARKRPETELHQHQPRDDQQRGISMTALAQAAIRQTARVSDFGAVAVFSLLGLTLSLAVAHFGIALGTMG